MASSGTSRRPVRPLQVRVGGVAVPSGNVLYHGPAPGLVLGVTQVNFVVPEVTPGAAIPVEVSSGTAISTGVTMAVR